MNRTVVVGDIHGCHEELLDLMDHVGPTDGDRVISVGDLVTKGPGNAAVIDFFRAGTNTSAVIGNHDRVLLEKYLGHDVKLETFHVQAIAEFGDRFGEYMKWVAALPHYLDLGDYLVVHAGLRPGRSLAEQDIKDLTEIRKVVIGDKEIPWFDVYEGNQTVIFGHWVFGEPVVKTNAIGIDTGCVYGGRLTACVLPERHLVSVPARRAYARKG
jgi:diadenosine tetraphosphatase ApaH/serine/threonine PP2A family protein phosphatase